MKIVRIIARLNVGGPAKHVVWLSAGLKEAGWEDILVAGSVPAGEEDMAYFAAEQGLLPRFIPHMSREVSPKDALTVWKLFWLFLRERPDVVHTHTAKAGTVGRVAGFLYRWLTPAALVGKPRRCVFVHTYHGHIFHGYYGSAKTSIFLTIEKLLARLITDRIIVVSAQQRREINETFGVGRPDQFSVVPLGLDLDLFAGWQARGGSFRNEIGVKPQDILVGIVGRLTEIKNHDLFLRSVSLFQRKYAGNSNVRFVVVGDGALREQLEARVDELGLRNEIIFAGNRKDPENFYPAMDIVALTSLNEGTPLTLIEAMANARPVIATAVGGVTDLLGEPIGSAAGLPYVICRRGLGVPPGNAEAFAMGLVRLVTDGKLREEIGANGLRYVGQAHSKERLLKDIELLYRKLADDLRKTGEPEQPLPESVMSKNRVY
jgi:glycosyltransferase involved in cell wall biosynthesis